MFVSGGGRAANKSSKIGIYNVKQRSIRPSHAVTAAFLWRPA